MTIVAGFVARDGLLLCADTLYTDGFTKVHRDKIFTIPLRFATVSFAVAGHAANARMAVEDCRSALALTKTHSVASILRTIRPVIKTIQAQYVDQSSPGDLEVARFYLLVAIQTRKEPPVLLATSSSGALEKLDTYDCLGSGRHLGHYIIEAGYRRDMTVNEAAVLCIQALSAAKKHVDGCGGKSQFLSMSRRAISAIVPHDIIYSETSVEDYQRATANLLLAIGDAESTDAVFRGELQRFANSVLTMRQQWKAHAEPWRELIQKLSRQTPLTKQQP